MALSGEYEPSPAEHVRKQVETFERTNGAEGNTMGGKPVVIVTSVGARSGKLRKTPVMRVEHDGRYAVVASKGGAPTNPVWYHNLTANPTVELQDGADRREMTVRELTGDERAAWWDRAVAAFPPYAEYQTRTDRQIPVLLLEPVS